jgi:arylsulfatase A-like enzyme
VTKLAACALAAVWLLAPGCGPSEDTRPDLVLVVVDTLRADHLSAYGYERPTSPGLDALARDGVVFLDNTAQSSWTLPSVASYMTGRHVFVNAQRLPDGVPSLAERLSAAGYETAAFIGNPAVSPVGNYDRGFDHFIGREATGNVTWDAADLHTVFARWQEDHPRDGRPRFLYLHFMDPHYPYEPRDPVDVGGEVVLRDDVLEAWQPVVVAAGEGSPIYDTFNQERVKILDEMDRYDQEIASMDAVLSSLLRTLGTRERLVVVASDHGEGLWNHEHHAPIVERKPPEERTLSEVFFRDHSYHLYQELIRTPLIVSGPGFPSGLDEETPVENVDIAPTLLRAAGLPDDPTLDGRALQDVVAGTARPRQAIFSHCNEATAVRVGGWKLVFPTPTGDSFGMPIQLYELDGDEHERRNRASDPEAVQMFRNLIRLREDAAESFTLYDSQEVGVDDAEQRAVLAELGYLDGGGAGDKR